jgi:endonuclease/exonuclease/phosphatase family metal-dependent hydrolase
MKKLKILSYNIHKGFSGGLAKYTLHEMREEIRRLHPDLIFLQEVHGHHGGHKKRIKNWADGSQFEFIAEGLWPHFSYGKNSVYPKGHHGNAILSKFPILSWENSDISKHRFERRGLLHAVIQISKSLPPLHAVCVHLGLFESGRQKQLKELTKRIVSMVPKKNLLVAAGDFNDWNEKATPSMNKLGLRDAYFKVHGEHARTFPSFFPVLKLDRIYCRGFEISLAEVLSRPPWNKLSDHAALHVNLDIPQKK